MIRIVCKSLRERDNQTSEGGSDPYDGPARRSPPTILKKAIGLEGVVEVQPPLTRLQ